MTATELLRELESSSWMVASASDATGAGVTASRRTSAFTVADSARLPRVLHAYSVLITTGDALRHHLALLVNVSSMHENRQGAIFVKQPVKSPSGQAHLPTKKNDLN